MYPKSFPTNYKAQIFYNEYLSLKIKLIDLHKKKLTYLRFNDNEEYERTNTEFEEVAKQLHQTLCNMEKDGFDMKDLIMLSLNVEVYAK